MSWLQDKMRWLWKESGEVEAVPDNSANALKVTLAKNFDELVTKRMS